MGIRVLVGRLLYVERVPSWLFVWLHQYKKSHCGEKAVVRSSYLHNGISFPDGVAYLSVCRHNNDLHRITYTMAKTLNKFVLLWGSDIKISYKYLKLTQIHIERAYSFQCLHNLYFSVFVYHKHKLRVLHILLTKIYQSTYCNCYWHITLSK